MLNLEHTTQFKKDLKLTCKRKKKLFKLEEIVLLIRKEQPLPPKNHNHKLSGDYKDHWECHIEPDWLLIYIKTNRVLTLIRTGSHADLFE